MQASSDFVSVSKSDAEAMSADLKAFVGKPNFPCVGARAALRRDQLEIIVASDIRRGSFDRLVTERLQNFATRNDSDDITFVSQAVIYQNERILSEIEFETFLWQRLSAFHAIDKEHYRWDPKVDSDPSSSHFSMSIGGKGFFVVGLHPNASRAARRFKYPTLIFNLHAQFERLRAEGRYETIRATTIKRDIALQGYANPMLARHGKGPAAAQYSGRLVDKDWKCPFSDA